MTLVMEGLLCSSLGLLLPSIGILGSLFEGCLCSFRIAADCVHGGMLRRLVRLKCSLSAPVRPGSERYYAVAGYCGTALTMLRASGSDIPPQHRVRPQSQNSGLGA
jgi:hypothetical protein